MDTLMAEATRQVADVLGTDYCKVLELNQSEATLLLRQGIGWSEGLVGTTEISAVDDESQAAYTLETTGPVVVEDLATEDRFSGPDLLTDHDVRSGISTIIGSASEPWGVLGAHATDVRSLSETDVTFVQSVANVLASAIKRRDDETRLRHQREQLSALNSINAVVRETTKAVIEQPTRDEIERVVCENLAETDSYAFAWVGEADADSDAVNVRTAAGTQGYLDDITVKTDPDDPDDPHGLGPTGRALRETEPQVARNLADNERHEPWDEWAAAAGVAASVAIPIAHDGSVYGVLNVYSERAEAFDPAELAVVGQLGEVVGHAIAATERKRALTSDEVVGSSSRSTTSSRT
ncbi:GAF domain-containing protein [Halomicroarcula sp. GCM10025710]